MMILIIIRSRSSSPLLRFSHVARPLAPCENLGIDAVIKVVVEVIDMDRQVKAMVMKDLKSS